MTSTIPSDPLATDNVRPLAWSGGDVAKDSFDAAVWLPLEEDRDRAMRDVPVKTFPRTRDGVDAFLHWADGLLADSVAAGGGPVPSLRVVMEATGSYSTELAVWMLAARPCLAPAVINPLTARDFARSLNLRNKTDKCDARALARYGAERRPVAYEPLSPEQAQLRCLSRRRQAVIEMRVAEENRLSEPIDSPWVLKTTKAHIRSLLKAEKDIEREMKKVLAKAPDLQRDCEAIDGVYGIGFVTAVAVVAELGDLRRFERARQLTAFAGLSPRREESGTTIRKPGRLCKKGSSRVRKALYFPAITAIRGDTDLADLYHRLLARGKTKKAALGTVMRKLLVVMRAILITGKPYQKRHRAACGKLRGKLAQQEQIPA